MTEALFDDVADIEKFRGLFDKEPLKSMMKRLFAFEEINHTHYISVV